MAPTTVSQSVIDEALPVVDRINISVGYGTRVMFGFAVMSDGGLDVPTPLDGRLPALVLNPGAATELEVPLLIVTTAGVGWAAWDVDETPWSAWQGNAEYVLTLDGAGWCRGRLTSGVTRRAVTEAEP